jgi:hypothetical protein
LKRLFSWQVLFAIVLVTLSLFFYFIHYLLFRDLHYLLNYFISNMAFLFMDVLIVMLVLQGLLQYREKQAVLKKLNMVIGTFYIEVGTELMKRLSAFAPDASHQLVLRVGGDWKDQDFLKARRNLLAAEIKLESRQGSLDDLKVFLHTRRQFLLNLLENANLLEHELFSDLLWAIFHLTDELEHRLEFQKLPEADYRHLSGDMQRAYQQLVLQWLDFMKHLKKDYPYLYSLAVRTNPFDPGAVVELQK